MNIEIEEVKDPIKLTEQREKEFQQFMQRANDLILENITKKAKSALQECYTDFGFYIESDSWLNFREELKRELAGKNFTEVITENTIWAKEVRQKIFSEYQEPLVAALNKDLAEEVEDLKQQIKMMHQRRIY